MLILALDTSGSVASCALLKDGVVLDELRQDSRLDHSRVLLPMCQSLLRAHNHTLADVDLFAAVTGPGSFTGIRIASAAVKGFGWSLDKPCAGVSSLLAMAYAARDNGETGVVCVSVHARANEAFFALFRLAQGAVIRLTEDDVSTEESIAAAMAAFSCTHRVCDGQSAAGAARAAWILAQAGETQTCHDITPAYLRITQAERMRKERLNQQ